MPLLIGQNKAWLVGNNGLIRCTNDFGITWQTQVSGTVTNLKAVQFLDALTGWAVGDEGTILKTTDGGMTWGGVSTGVVGSNNAGDPSVVIDLEGNEYVGHMIKVSSTPLRLRQFVAYSTDGGSTFTDVRVDVGTVNNDKNHLWVDNSRVSPYAGNLYDVWSAFLNNVEIEFLGEFATFDI